MNEELSPDVIIKELETPGSNLWRWSRDRHSEFSDSRVSALVTIKDDVLCSMKAVWVA
jgi:hypothetical protein